MTVSRVDIELVRERETFRYASSLITSAVRNDPASLIPPHQLRTSSDSALTAFAQLAVLRLNASRCLVSLFDSRLQHVVAEATPSLSLAPGAKSPAGEDLWLCNTSFPRSFGVCEHVLDLGAAGAAGELPVSVVPDLLRDDRYRTRPFCKAWPRHRFYAGVPIRTERGIDIGVLSAFGTEPHQGLDPASISFLADLSGTVMRHLKIGSARDVRRRVGRMVRGIGSFVQGTDTIAGSRNATVAESFEEDNPSRQGTPNVYQQALRLRRRGEDAAAGENTPEASPPKEEPDAPPAAAPAPLASVDVDLSLPKQTPQSRYVLSIFLKAANIIRESIEAEGVLFLDASISSFSGYDFVGVGTSDGQHSPASSGDDAGDARCRPLSFSTSIHPTGGDGDPGISDDRTMAENLLRKLMERHPGGKIFNFDRRGLARPSTSYGDEDVVGEAARDLEGGRQPGRPSSSPPFSRTRTGKKFDKAVIGLFPGARSIAFFPLWDPQRQRWFAGGFAYIKSSTRLLSAEDELGYLVAFGAVIMAQVVRADARRAEKLQANTLNSLSHELRSPLHGIITGAELLHDTALDVFQGNILHSIETCGRTLMDTMDHLLDWSKLNNFLRVSAKQRRRGRTKAADGEQSGSTRSPDGGGAESIEAGMMSIMSNVDLGVLVEEVIESVCADNTLHKQSSVPRPAGDAAPDPDFVDGVSSSSVKRADGVPVAGRNVTVSLAVDPEASWIFHTQSGALGRIIMNLVGNSLKFTAEGFVQVTLDQEDPTPAAAAAGDAHGDFRDVLLTVVDSGQGISEDYLMNHMFCPFSQEDYLSPGPGLGLTIVRQIVKSLGGSIRVESAVGRGTRVSVRLPLELADADPAAAVRGRHGSLNPFDDFWTQVDKMKGLRVRLLGFPDRRSARPPESHQDKPHHDDQHDDSLFKGVLDEHAVMERLCRTWLRMQVTETLGGDGLAPDLFLCDDRHLDKLLEADRDARISAPVIVICRNSLLAHKLATSRKYAPRGVFEFSCRPVGPRKLAKVLSLTLNRWAELQSMASRSPTLTFPSPHGSLPPTPFQDMTKDPFVDRSPPPPEADIGESRPQSAAAARGRFLLVEDNPINLNILILYMKKLGLPCSTATDGLKALDAFRADPREYRCVLMDISMPVMDGFEATREIRTFERDAHLARCPIFALTGLASAEAQTEAQMSGIDLFLTKPVRLRELTRIFMKNGLV